MSGEMRRMPRALKDKKAVSPVVASLLLIVIVVAAGAMLFTFMSGLVPATLGQPRPPAHSITFDGAIRWNLNYNGTTGYAPTPTGFTPGMVTFVITNMGTENVTIKNVQVVTSEGALITIADTTSDGDDDDDGSAVDSRLLPNEFAVATVRPVQTTLANAVFTSGNNTIMPGTNYVMVRFTAADLPPLKDEAKGFETGRTYNFIIVTTDNFKIPFLARSS